MTPSAGQPGVGRVRRRMTRRQAARKAAFSLLSLRSGHAPGLVSLVSRVSLVSLVSLASAGCLPSSRRGETTSLLASDSLSRRVAAGAPVDTLHLVWRGANEGLQLPTSIGWLTTTPEGAGRLVVADTRAGSLRLLDAASGVAIDASASRISLAFPYLAGVAGDTAIVLVRGDDRLSWVDLGGPAPREAHTVPLPAGATAAVVTRTAVWVKRADEYEAWLARLDRSGRTLARYRLPGPSWRYIGFLRASGDTLLSLSGYRPVVDLLPPRSPTGATPDTLALVGFDSPQMVRSHRFLLGEVDQPPLLTSSSALDSGRLFVINLRGDHLRVDVFGRDGRLERGLVYIAPEDTQDHFPVDLAVRHDGTGALLALVMQRPGGLLSESGGYVLMLRWPGPTPAS